ncbi:Uroporphyrinogen-III synthase [Hondaea fermentalgiana]|uniref:Uroporphyrinogen-III synthase n=1 Tax=Hondaea fermentalgiana TaxID=2315210 RepID=A0A2R5GW66_9STRA|nr:Uroporphyrinogen-III synthase [Hondaea fermentalgiana]|eukprot:GBG35070.1 Uroporphyrinogen-III synthase [Hondaea fermentalgiana]
MASNEEASASAATPEPAPAPAPELAAVPKPPSLPPFKVLLLKEPAKPCKYATTLAPRNGTVSYCPVLAFERTPDAAQRVVDAILKAQPGDASPGQLGVVVTSPRAAEVIADALRLLETTLSVDERANVPSWLRSFPVGEETASRLGTFASKSMGKAGSAKDLLPEILAWVGEAKASRRVLFVSGNLRRDTIPHGLQEAGISMEEIVVYRTIPDPSPALPEEWTRLQEATINDSPSVPRFAVFFSPSGVTCIAGASSAQSLASDVRLVAIGKTSAASLESDGAALLAHAAQPQVMTCLAPSPSGLLEVIQAEIMRHTSGE